jgi:hypothetical protein
MSSPEPPGQKERLQRIVQGLIERTETKSIKWEQGAPPDSWAVTVALTRFRVRSLEQPGQPPFALELFADRQINIQTGSDQRWDALIARLYAVARQSATEAGSDALSEVEKQLGLGVLP